jgi:phage FluMu protein Com
VIVSIWTTCPRCKQLHNVLSYTPMGLIDEFKNETNPIYKCPSCRWLFSPSDGLIPTEIVEAMLNA